MKKAAVRNDFCRSAFAKRFLLGAGCPLLFCASAVLPLQAASNLYFDSNTSGAGWDTSTDKNWSTSSSGGGTLSAFANGDYAYFTVSGEDGDGGVTIGSAGVQTPRIVVSSGSITFSPAGSGGITLEDDTATSPSGYTLFN